MCSGGRTGRENASAGGEGENGLLGDSIAHWDGGSDDDSCEWWEGSM